MPIAYYRSLNIITQSLSGHSAALYSLMTLIALPHKALLKGYLIELLQYLIGIMLSHLSVKNIVLIESLQLDFQAGLTVLTGETGPENPSCLIHWASRLARANFGLLRKGADRASVTATFEVSADHPVWPLLEDSGIEQADELIIRRQLRQDGKSPASINDEPVSVNLLRQCGDMLVEIQGQFEGRGLLDARNHLGLLDRACQHDDSLAKLKDAYRGWQKAKTAFLEAEAEAQKAKDEEDWLRDAVEQLDLLAPQAGEDIALSEERALFTNLEKIAEALTIADDALRAEAGAEASVSRALSAIERVSEASAGRLDNALDALSRTMAELSEANAALGQLASNLKLILPDCNKLMIVSMKFAHKHANIM